MQSKMLQSSSCQVTDFEGFRHQLLDLEWTRAGDLGTADGRNLAPRRANKLLQPVGFSAPEVGQDFFLDAYVSKTEVHCHQHSG